MPAILITALRLAASAAAGWAISDFFNERQASKQAQRDANYRGTARTNWVKWVVIGIIVMLISLIFFVIIRTIKSTKK